MPSKTGIFVFPSPVEVLWSNPAGLQHQIPWGFPVPLSGPQARNPGGVLNIQNSGRTSLVLFYSLWATHLMGMRFDFIVIVPLHHLASASSLSLDVGYIFSGSFQCPPVNGGSTACCDFGALTEKDEHTSFYSAILNQKPYLTTLMYMHSCTIFWEVSEQLRHFLGEIE